MPGFANTYLPKNEPYAVGAKLRQPHIADTLGRLSQVGLSDFYRGDVARAMVVDLEKVGSPLRLADLEQHQASLVTPISLDVAGHKVFNLPPPTQGLASLLILGLYARSMANEADGVDYLHRLIESTKAAFRVRNRYVTDPDPMEKPADFLTEESLAALEKTISHERASPWPDPPAQGDTV